MKRIKALLQTFICILAVLGVATVAGASGILGDTVTIQYYYPNTSSPWAGISSTGAVTAGGLSLNLFSNQQVTVYPNYVEMMGIATGGSAFAGGAFNGVSVQDVTNPSVFTGFSIDPVSNVVGFDITDVSLVSGLLYINYQGLGTPYNSVAQVDFTTGTAVPEPTTMLLLGLGLIGVAGVRRFKK